MPIPDYQSIMLPLLKLISDKREHEYNDTVEKLCKEFNLTEEEMNEMIPSGTQSYIKNRIGWARTYLKKAGLLEYTSKGHYKITERGLDVLNKNPEKINNKILKQFDEFKEFQRKKKKKSKIIEEIDEENISLTPKEALEYGYDKINESLASDLLSTIKGCSPKFFEKLVVELLVKMGYGGSEEEASEVIGKPGDEGIDGIIKEDKLGLDVIYVQAKRWDNVVGRPEIQKFVGALSGKRAKKGIFITTSKFTREAEDYVNNIDTKVILIDGVSLAEYMIEYTLGVSVEDVYEIKKIDQDYFMEE